MQAGWVSVRITRFLATAGTGLFHSFKRLLDPQILTFYRSGCYRANGIIPDVQTFSRDAQWRGMQNKA